MSNLVRKNIPNPPEKWEEIAREDRGGYILSHRKNAADGEEVTHAETREGHYIGNAEKAAFLCDEMGIAPELRGPLSDVCSIGFCAKENKWYGWSHRAICGFTVGSQVRRGDLAYVPDNLEEMKKNLIDFWTGRDSYHENADVSLSKDESGHTVFKISWTHTHDVPNEKLRGEPGCAVHYPPENFGRGEWEALTLDDAKQMAIDYAKGVC